MQDRKIMRALYDFEGAPDELSFQVGDEITVVSEVLEGWWLGELSGKQGLFPTPYTETVPTKPPLPSRPDLSGGKKNAAKGYRPSGESTSSGTDDDDGANELDEKNILDANLLSPSDSPFFGSSAASPMAAHHADNESIMSSLMSEGEDESDYLVRSKQGPSSAAPRSLFSSLAVPSLSQRSSSDVSTSSSSSGIFNGSSKKNPPPPPPPRRMTPTPTATPPIPARRPSGIKSQSFGSVSGSGSYLSTTPGSSVSSHGYDTSPFESVTEFQLPSGCDNFKQNPFKPKGMCSNCSQHHREAHN